MTRAVCIGALPIRLPEDKHEIEFTIADPGIVRAVAFCLEQRLVMTSGAPSFNEVLTLFVEFSPNAPQRKRRFLLMETGRTVSVPDGHALAFVGSAVSGNTGHVAHVYEIKAVS